LSKFERNVARDDRNREELERQGWTVVVLWECQLRGIDWLIPVQGILDAARLRPTNKLRMEMDCPL
jgi:DNA mismatch endonuclease (patch repair protein)